MRDFPKSKRQRNEYLFFNLTYDIPAISFPVQIERVLFNEDEESDHEIELSFRPPNKEDITILPPEFLILAV